MHDPTIRLELGRHREADLVRALQRKTRPVVVEPTQPSSATPLAGPGRRGEQRLALPSHRGARAWPGATARSLDAVAVRVGWSRG